MIHQSFPVGRWALLALVLAGVGSVSSYLMIQGKPVFGGEPARAEGAKAIPTVNVEVISPRPGGIDRVCVQPGSIEPYEAADLYAKVSGYLIEQKVDIGDSVRQGDVLARLSVPEYESQVKQDRDDILRTEARVEQMAAAIASAEADVGAANAGIALAQAELKSKKSYRAYREKQRTRIRDLASREAIEVKLAEESEDFFQSASSAELAAEEAINAARQKEAAAAARVKQARADLKYATAEVAVARARLEKSQALLDYTIIRSPYTGVITKRNFHRGDFIRSADAGGDRMAILAVERTDMMRVVIQVPERDVPYVDIGDPAIIEVDALPGVRYKSDGTQKVEISRFAASEDPHTRMMRVEVHLKNADGKLRRGMFGHVTLLLQSGAPSSVRIPSAALVGRADGEKKASVRFVQDDVVRIGTVRFDSDNGTDVEILSGVTPSDRVIVRAGGPVDNGTLVTATPVSSKSVR